MEVCGSCHPDSSFSKYKQLSADTCWKLAFIAEFVEFGGKKLNFHAGRSSSIFFSMFFFFLDFKKIFDQSVLGNCTLQKKKKKKKASRRTNLIIYLTHN